MTENTIKVPYHGLVPVSLSLSVSLLGQSCHFYTSNMASLFLALGLAFVGSSTSGVPNSRASPGLWPVRNRAAQQVVSGRQASEVSSVFTAALHRLHYRPSSASCRHYGEL